MRDWLISWFADRGQKPGLNENFFESGAVDSLGIIELIEDIEAHFGIAFANRDFQDRRFSSIAGLSEIIGGKL